MRKPLHFLPWHSDGLITIPHGEPIAKKNGCGLSLARESPAGPGRADNEIHENIIILRYSKCLS
jgi:hypothetical protein